MRRTDDVRLWPWPLTLKLVRSVAHVVEYPPANFGDTTTICWRFIGYWAFMSVCVARRHRYQSIAVAASCWCLERRRKWTNNCFSAKKCGFRNLFSKIWHSQKLQCCDPSFDPPKCHKWGGQICPDPTLWYFIFFRLPRISRKSSDTDTV